MRGEKDAPGHKIYPFLLRGVKVERPNQVWATDVTYIPMARGFVYLVAVVDWFTRRVLSHRVSIALEADFCVEALEEASPKRMRRCLAKTKLPGSTARAPSQCRGEMPPILAAFWRAILA